MKSTHEASATSRNPISEQEPIPRTKYINHIRRARDTSSYFAFFRDYTKIMSKLEALFLQDLINLSSLAGIKRTTIDGEDYFLCTIEFLEKSAIGWSVSEQKQHFKSLKKRGFINSIRVGIPAKRLVSINFPNVEEAIDNKLGEKPPIQLGEKSPNWWGEKPPDYIEKKEQEKKEQKYCRSIPSDDVSSTCSGGFLPKEKTLDPDFVLDQERSDRLYQIIYQYLKDSQRKDVLPPNPKLGPRWMKRIRIKYPSEFIEKALAGYPRIIGREYKPEAFCAKTFHDKLPKIVLALDRNENEKPQTQAEEVGQEHIDRVTKLKTILRENWKGNDFNSARAFAELDRPSAEIDKVLRCWGYYANDDYWTEIMKLPTFHNGEEWCRRYDWILKNLRKNNLFEEVW